MRSIIDKYILQKSQKNFIFVFVFTFKHDWLTFVNSPHQQNRHIRSEMPADAQVRLLNRGCRSKKLLSRAVFVVDKGGILRHSETVSAGTSEPDDRSALDILLSLLDPAAWLWAATD